jgi:uncharacterized membrane protein YeaQ/YmgE (transglycosylase-associated protein family)
LTPGAPNADGDLIDARNRSSHYPSPDYRHDRMAGPSWFTRQFSGSNRGLITSALVGIAGAFIGFHVSLLLALGTGLLVWAIAAAAGAAVVLFAWRAVK